MDVINREYPPGVFLRGLKFSGKKIRGLKFLGENLRGESLTNFLGFSEENTPGGYSPLK